MAVQHAASLSKARKTSNLARFERRWGLIFLSPWIIGFSVFFFLPMIASLILSFTNLNLVQPEDTRFVGLANWQQMLVDPNVRISLGITLRFMAISIPVSLTLPLAFALLLNSSHLRAKRLFRTLFYLPYMIPLVAGTIIWQGVLNTQSGWLNNILEFFGLARPDWLNDPSLVIPTLTLIGVWGVGNAMIVFLAGLQNVPTELYEAARVDGAGATRCFFSITIPLISSVIFYNLVLAVIGGFQEFLRALIIYGSTNGAGPNNAALFYMVNLYREAFVYYKMGYASALAWALFLVALAVTIGLFGSAQRWVYYANNENS